MNPIEDIKAVVEKAQTQQQEPNEEDIRYFFVCSPREYIEKIVITGYEGPSKEEITAIRGYVFGHPIVSVRLVMPYPIFKTMEELKEHYRRIFE